jgi:predicted AlkP superfamily phosphohydrolase/phosphomutase
MFRRAVLLLAAALIAAGCGGSGGPRHGHRLLIVGWDGATFDMVDPLVAAGRLPNLTGLIDRGRTAYLSSTVVPISSAAWVGAVTGGTPARTGVYDFFERLPESYDVRLISSRSSAMPPLWRIAGWHGLRSIVVGVPVTWPPETVDGVLVAGMLSPFDADYAHPPGLASELRARGFEPDLGIWRDHQELTPQRMARQLEVKRDVLVEMLAGNDWDLAMIVFKSLDVLGHRAYDGHTDTVVASWYEHLDTVLGNLLAVTGPEIDVIVLSDHGFASYGRLFFPHAWLLEQGYATALEEDPESAPPSGPLATARRAERLRTIGSLDLSRTRALVDSSEGNFGGIRLNLRGREPQGVVAPSAADALLQEITERLLAARVPGDGGRLVTRVWRAGQLYPGPFEHNLPDLLFEVDPSVAVRPVPNERWFANASRPFPDHARDGIWVAAGPSMPPARERARYDIFDLAPTALHLLGLPVHQEMTGRSRAPGAPRVVSGRALASGRTGIWVEAGADGATPAEVLERLRALGYAETLEPEPVDSD